MDSITEEERALILEALWSGKVTKCETGAHALPIDGSPTPFVERRKQMFEEWRKRGVINRRRRERGLPPLPTVEGWMNRHSAILRECKRIVGVK